MVWSFSLYLTASSSLAIFILASVLSFSASLWIPKTWEREAERERERESKWVQQQTPSNITQQNSSACDLVNLVSSLLSITPSIVPSEAICLHRGPLTLDLWQRYGPFLCPDTVLWPLTCFIYHAWGVERAIFAWETKWKMNDWLFHCFHLVSPCRKKEKTERWK